MAQVSGVCLGEPYSKRLELCVPFAYPARSAPLWVSGRGTGPVGPWQTTLPTTACEAEEARLLNI